MFSPRYLAVFALLVATIAAIPTTNKPAIPKPVTTITEDDIDDTPWFSFPLFGNLFAPLWRLLPSFGEIGPRIVADDDKFQVIVNVKDYKKEDLKVKVKSDFIFVQGAHEAKKDDHDVFASQFFHTYTLPANSSGADVTASLTSDGFLVVNAPVNGPSDKTKDSDRDVPIVETGVPYKKEEETTKTKDEKVTTTKDEKVTTTKDEKATPPAPIEDIDDRKEPTTPSSKTEESKEKDNNIPHGNEIPL